MKDNNSLAHSTWNCKYHLVFINMEIDAFCVKAIM